MTPLQNLQISKNIIKEYYKQYYVNKFDNLEEMHKFFERHKLGKLSQEEMDNLNRPISIKETKFFKKKFQKRKIWA